MPWQRHMYELIYRRGKPRWETDRIPEVLVDLVEGAQALPPGRAIDLGCGTGSHAVYLAQHCWQVVGVDFSATAVRAARKKAGALRGVEFVEGDVTRLGDAGIQGPFSLVLDVGCFHGIPAARHDAYVDEVARITVAGSLVVLWAIDAERRSWVPGEPRADEREIRRRFAAQFDILSARPGSIFHEGGETARWPARWYVMQRRDPGVHERPARSIEGGPGMGEHGGEPGG